MARLVSLTAGAGVGIVHIVTTWPRGGLGSRVVVSVLVVLVVRAGWLGAGIVRAGGLVVCIWWGIEGSLLGGECLGCG